MHNWEEQQTRGLYRSRHGMFFGVCRGIAEYLDFSVFWTRVLALILIFSSGFTGLIVYILIALLMKPEPVLPFQGTLDREFYDSYLHSRKMALYRLKRVYDNLERRICRMESIVTAHDYDWDRRFNE